MGVRPHARFQHTPHEISVRTQVTSMQALSLNQELMRQRSARVAVSQGRCFGEVYAKGALFGWLSARSDRTHVSRAVLKKHTYVFHLPSTYVRTCTRARASASSRARASVRPRARLAVTDDDRGACSAHQSVQRVLRHFVDHALGQPTAVGGDRCGVRDAGRGGRCGRARSAEVILFCAVACDWRRFLQRFSNA